MTTCEICGCTITKDKCRWHALHLQDAAQSPEVLALVEAIDELVSGIGPLTPEASTTIQNAVAPFREHADATD